MKRIFLFCFLILGSYVFADACIKDFFNLNQDFCKKVEIKFRGTYDYHDIKDKNYEECWIFCIEKTNGIDTILCYPAYNNKTNPNEGKIQIGEQIFITKDKNLYVPELEIYSINYNEKIYLLFLGKVGKYGDKICFIFDITDPDNIKFYPPEERFVCKEVADNFAGIFQNKFCFLFSIWVSDTRLEYKLIPYYIEDNVLKMLCDEKGDAYYVRYYFLDRFEQQLVIEDVHLPDKR